MRVLVALLGFAESTKQRLMNEDEGLSTAELLGNAALATAITVFAIRVGLLALIVGFVFFGTMTSMPLSMGSEVWHTGPAVLTLALVAAATVFGVRTATRAVA